ncbi:hypothetical protein DFJ73DRAFT_820821 [Zopfochytrium polystomum]|nr:hypothetical protein DFJ73DRAFT_820821 [Zopfochytrium polystomum]
MSAPPPSPHAQRGLRRANSSTSTSSSSKFKSRLSSGNPPFPRHQPFITSSASHTSSDRPSQSFQDEGVAANNLAVSHASVPLGPSPAVGLIEPSSLGSLTSAPATHTQPPTSSSLRSTPDTAEAALFTLKSNALTSLRRPVSISKLNVTALFSSSGGSRFSKLAPSGPPLAASSLERRSYSSAGAASDSRPSSPTSARHHSASVSRTLRKKYEQSSYDTVSHTPDVPSGQFPPIDIEPQRESQPGELVDSASADSQPHRSLPQMPENRRLSLTALSTVAMPPSPGILSDTHPSEPASPIFAPPLPHENSHIPPAAALLSLTTKQSIFSRWRGMFHQARPGSSSSASSIAVSASNQTVWQKSLSSDQLHDPSFVDLNVGTGAASSTNAAPRSRSWSKNAVDADRFWEGPPAAFKTLNAAGKTERAVLDVDPKALDPETLASHLFTLSIANITKRDVCAIIGKSDAFHMRVLEHYMDHFDFLYVDLDVALRRLTSHLHLSGETHLIDRILLQLARRYWECNPDAQQIYRSADVVHGILFSVILLNTDLHLANTGSNVGKRMQKRTFVKNTLDLVDKMIADDPEVSQDLTSIGLGNVRLWRKDIEAKLETSPSFFTPMRAAATTSFDKLKDSSTPSDESGRRQSGSLASGSSGEIKKSLPSRLHSNTTVPSVAAMSITARLAVKTAAAQAHDVTMQLQQLSLFETGNFLAQAGSPTSPRHSASSPQLRSSSLNVLCTFTSSSVATDGVQTSISISPPSVGSEGHSIRINPRSSFSGSDNSANSGANRRDFQKPLMSGIAMEGLMIRKHFEEKEGVKARNRKWVKVWCVLAVDDDRGVELTAFKVESHVQADGEVGFAEAETSLPLDSAESRKLVIKIANQPPQVHNLLHSFSHALKPPGYSPTRPFVFNLTLSNGGVYLFQTPTSEFLLEWTKTLNYWAARKSKEPLPGALGNVEYGWTDAAWERRERERRDKVGFTGSSGLQDLGGGNSRRKVKIEDWTPPGHALLVSSLSEDLQLASMRKMADFLANELEEHISFKTAIETRWSNPAMLARAKDNWVRKKDYLTREYKRYSMYAQILRTSLNFHRYDDFERQSSSPSAPAGSLSVQRERVPATSPPPSPAGQLRRSDSTRRPTPSSLFSAPAGGGGSSLSSTAPSGSVDGGRESIDALFIGIGGARSLGRQDIGEVYPSSTLTILGTEPDGGNVTLSQKIELYRSSMAEGGSA